MSTAPTERLSLLQQSTSRWIAGASRRHPVTLVIMTAFFVTVRTMVRQKKLVEIKNDFINNMTHELKTPIAGLAGFIETLRGPAREDAAARERFLGIMAEQADRIENAVKKVLAQGYRTGDILTPGCKQVGTVEMGEAVLAAL